MDKLKRLFYAVIILVLIPFVMVISSVVENKYFPVLQVEAINVRHYATEKTSNVEFQIRGYKLRACTLKNVNVKWSLGDKIISKEDVIYKAEDNQVYTYPMNVKKADHYTTVPLVAKIDGNIPDNSKLIIHYVYYCHFGYNNEFDLLIPIPSLEK